MNLSKLQKFILLKASLAKGKWIKKEEFLVYYLSVKSKTKNNLKIKIVSKSLERLISRGLLNCLCFKTANKCYIEEVILTKKGRGVVKLLKGKQLSMKL